MIEEAAVNGQCRIDVWDVPWGDKNTLTLQLQLAHMLSKASFWKLHTYIRVCSIIEEDDDDLHGTEARYKELHQKVIRETRLEAQIQVFVLAWDAPKLLEKLQQDAQMVGAEDVMNDGKGPLAALMASENGFGPLADLVHDLIAGSSESTAVSMLPLCPLVAHDPNPDEELRNAQEYITLLARVTEGIGPTVLVSAQEDTVSTDL